VMKGLSIGICWANGIVREPMPTTVRERPVA
jgi:hypothetical protein